MRMDVCPPVFATSPEAYREAWGTIDSPTPDRAGQSGTAKERNGRYTPAALPCVLCPVGVRGHVLMR